MVDLTPDQQRKANSEFSMERASTALRNAHDAGDVEGARKLAGYIKTLAAKKPAVDPMTPTAPLNPEGRARAEKRLNELPGERAEIQGKRSKEERNIELMRPGVRLGASVNRALLGPAAMLESIVKGAMDIGKKGPMHLSGMLPDEMPTPFNTAYNANVPDNIPGAEDRNALEGFATRAEEMALGAGTGVGAAQNIARTGATTASRELGQLMADQPVRQFAAATTGAVGGEAVEQAGGGPFSQMLGTLLSGAAALPGAGTKAKAPRPEAGPLLPKPAVKPSEVARAAGLVTPPSATPGAKGAMLESLVGAPQLSAKASLKNQSQLDRHVRAELELKGEQGLSKQTYRNLEKPQHAVYEEVRNTVPALVVDDELKAAIESIGAAQRDNPLLEVGPKVTQLQARLSKQDPTLKTADVMKAVADWRHKARTYAKSLDDPEKHAQGKAFQAAADSFEDAIERQASAAGKEDLGTRFRGARTQLAKIHDAEAATVDGMIDASVFEAMKKAGRPLSGRFDMIADLARWFRPETKHASTVRIPNERLPPWWRTAVGRAIQVIGRRPVDAILFGDKYQGQFGAVDQAPGPGSPLSAYFDAPPTPPAPKGPSGPTGSGSVDFERSPGVPPSSALRNVDPGELELLPDPVPGAVELPPAANRPGDLTASTPPAPEGLPFSGTNLDDNFPRNLGDEFATTPYQDTFPGARVPEEAALTEWFTNQPIAPAPARASTAIERNASGESSASLEAISRAGQEQAAGQGRFLIDRDGSITPLVGVDAVDAVAQPGQSIVQRGVGADDFTILDRGGQTQRAAQAQLTRSRAQLDETAPLGDAVTGAAEISSGGMARALGIDEADLAALMERMFGRPNGEG